MRMPLADVRKTNGQVPVVLPADILPQSVHNLKDEKEEIVLFAPRQKGKGIPSCLRQDVQIFLQSFVAKGGKEHDLFLLEMMRISRRSSSLVDKPCPFPLQQR